MDLFKILEEIDMKGSLYENAVEEAKERQLILAKPTGALGMLEDITVKMAGITGKVLLSPKKKLIAIFSADNGVWEEGVASAPQTVTLSQTINFLRHYTGVSSISNHFGIDLLVFDMGGKYELPRNLYTDKIEAVPGGKVPNGKFAGKAINRRLGCGTKNLYKEPAMDRETLLKAIETGFESAKFAEENGYDLFGIGEMGIGNTTTSSAVLSALTNEEAALVVGRGGGLNDEGLKKKVKIVKESVERLELGRDLSEEDVLKILESVGGYDIAAMVGAYLGAAYYRIPVVIDGYISAVAALAAYRLCPNVENFMFGSHQSTEPGYLIAMNEIGVKPLFNLGMRLGEGSGCPISFMIIETAESTMTGMATFAEGSIDADYLFNDDAKEGKFF